MDRDEGESKKKESEILLEIGMKIREFRKAEGLTQEELGSKIGVRKADISKYERGYVNIGILTAYKLAEIFNTTFDVFREKDAESEELFFLDAGDKAMSKYPAEAQAEIRLFLDYLDHKYNLDNK